MKSMSRVLLLLLAVSLALGLCACDRNKNNTTPATTAPIEHPEQNVETMTLAALQGGQALTFSVYEGTSSAEFTVALQNGELILCYCDAMDMASTLYAENAQGDVFLSEDDGASGTVYAAADNADLRAAVRETMTVLFSAFDLQSGGDCSYSAGQGYVATYENDTTSVEASFAVNGSAFRLKYLEATQIDGSAYLSVAPASTYGASIPTYEELVADAMAEDCTDENEMQAIVTVLRTYSRGATLEGAATVDANDTASVITIEEATMTPRVFGRPQQTTLTINSDGASTALVLTSVGGTFSLCTENANIYAGEGFSLMLSYLLSSMMGGGLPMDGEVYGDVYASDNGSTEDDLMADPNFPLSFTPDGGVDIQCDGNTVTLTVTGLTYTDETATYVLDVTLALAAADEAPEVLELPASKSVEIELDTLLGIAFAAAMIEVPEGGATQIEGNLRLQAQVQILPIDLKIDYSLVRDDDGYMLHLDVPYVTTLTDRGVKDMIGDAIVTGGNIKTDIWYNGTDLYMKVQVTVKYLSGISAKSKVRTDLYHVAGADVEAQMNDIILTALNINTETFGDTGMLPPGSDGDTSTGGGDSTGGGNTSGGDTTTPPPEDTRTPIEKVLQANETVFSLRSDEENGCYRLTCLVGESAPLLAQFVPDLTEEDLAAFPEGTVLTLTLSADLTSATLSLQLAENVTLSLVADITILDVTPGTACPNPEDFVGTLG